jgi:hypothetical protein
VCGQAFFLWGGLVRRLLIRPRKPGAGLWRRAGGAGGAATRASARKTTAPLLAAGEEKGKGERRGGMGGVRLFECEGAAR